MAHTYGNLTLITCDETLHSRTCGYWYLVQSEHRAHKAFATRKALSLWLEHHGIDLAFDNLPEHGKYSHHYMGGHYLEECHMDANAFEAVNPFMEIRHLSNGDYTLGKITIDGDGVRTVHYLNPNVKMRPVFDYRQSDAIYCGRASEREVA